jgi:hypothetical protein
MRPRRARASISFAGPGPGCGLGAARRRANEVGWAVFAVGPTEKDWPKKGPCGWAAWGAHVGLRELGHACVAGPKWPNTVK